MNKAPHMWTKDKAPHMWTKDEVKVIRNLWESESIESLAQKLNVEVQQLKYIVSKMHEVGFKDVK